MLSRLKKVDRLRAPLAAAFAFLAGVVDALGFLALGGFFVSFMTGNTTRLAVGVARDRWAEAGEGGLILALFVTGAVLGFALAQAPRLKPATGLVLALLLVVSALIHQTGHDRAAALSAAVAMGFENAAFQSMTGTATALTYMTGTLVQIARRLVDAFAGGPRLAWLEPLSLWLALTVGAIVGARCYAAYGLDTLWAAAALATLLGAALRPGVSPLDPTKGRRP